MSERPIPKWEADGFRIVYDRTPGGVVNEHGQRSYSMRIPVLEVTEWVTDREKVAADIAQELNEIAAKDAEIKRIQDLVTSSEQERYRAAGALIAKDLEIAKLREALAPFREVAGKIFAKNYNASDVVMDLTLEKGMKGVFLRAGQFFAVAAAASASEDTTHA